VAFKLILKAFAKIFVPVLGVIAFLLVVYISMAAIFAINFGRDLEEFSTPWAAFVSAFKFMHGGFDFDRYEVYVPSVIVFIFYFFHLYVIGYTAVNILIGILLEMYSSLGEYEIIASSSFSYLPSLQTLKTGFRYNLTKILASYPDKENITRADLIKIGVEPDGILKALGTQEINENKRTSLDNSQVVFDENNLLIN